MMAIPALIDGDGPALFESLAILEYIDETHPNPPLMPKRREGARACPRPVADCGVQFTSIDRAARARVSDA